jgi:hypothetical protein
MFLCQEQSTDKNKFMWSTCIAAMPLPAKLCVVRSNPARIQSGSF